MLYIHCDEIIYNIKSIILYIKHMLENIFLMNFDKFKENILQLYSIYNCLSIKKNIR